MTIVHLTDPAGINHFVDDIDFNISGNAVSIALKDKEEQVTSNTVFLLKFNESYGVITDSANRIKTSCIHPVNVEQYTLDGAYDSAYSFSEDGSYIRIDQSRPEMALVNDIAFTCVISPEDATSLTEQWLCIAKMAGASGPMWALGIRDSKLLFSYFSINRLVEIEGPDVLSLVSQKVGFNLVGDTLTLGVNGVEQTTTLTTVLSSSAAPFYIGYDPVSESGQYQGIIDDAHFYDAASAVFTTPAAAKYSDATPYVDVFDSVSGPFFSPNKIIIDEKDTSRGQIGIAITGDGGATWNYWDGAWIQHVSGHFVNSVEEANAHLDEFLAIFGSSISQFGIRVFLISDGRQFCGVDNVSIVSTDEDHPIRLGQDKQVVFGKSIKPFSDAFTLVRDYVPIENEMALGADISLFIGSEEIVFGDIYYRNVISELRAYSVWADNSLVSPSDLFGTGELSAEIVYTVSYADDDDRVGTDTLTLTIVPRYVTLLVLDRDKVVIPATVYVKDENGNIVIGQFDYTQETVLSLLDGTYTAVVSVGGYDDVEITFAVESDRHLTVMFETPLEVARNLKRADITIEAIIVESDLQSITRGDTPRIEFVIRDRKTFLEKDLNGYQIYFSAVDQYGTGAVVIDKLCTIDTLRKGHAYVDLAESDTATVGRLRCEVSIIRTSAPDKVLTSPDLWELDIKNDIHR